jgi:Holliday junction resolvase RusA-like endonuclease
MSRSSWEVQPGQSATSVVFEFPGVLPGMNEIVAAAKGEGGRGTAYSRMKATYTLLIKAMARAQYKGAPFARYRLRFQWFLKDARKDPDNIIAAKKFILDGMVAAKVLANDTQKNFLGIISETWEIRASKPGVEVTVEAAP